MQDQAFENWWKAWLDTQTNDFNPLHSAKAAWKAALEHADEISEDVGMKCYQNGDKAGWAACDEVGHVLRQDFE